MLSVLLRRFIGLSLLVLCIGCQSESSTNSNSDNPSGSGGNTDQPTEGDNNVDVPTTQVQNQPSPQELINPQESSRTPVRLINADGLQPLTSDSLISGWASIGNCGNGNAEMLSGGGKRGFMTLSDACVLSQATDTRIGDKTISLEFAISAAANFSNADESANLSISAELLAIADDGTEQTIDSKQYSLSPDAFDWQSRQLLMLADQRVDVAEHKLGVRFRAQNVGSEAVFLSDVSINLFDADASVASSSDTPAFQDTWTGVCNQAWAGASYWANRLHDWEVTQGRLQTRNVVSYRPLRSVHRLTSAMSASPESFELQVSTGVVEGNSNSSFSGILIGAGGNLDYRAAALIHNRSGRDGGLIAGVDNRGQAFLHDNGVLDTRLKTANERTVNVVGEEGVSLLVRGEYQGESRYKLTVSVLNAEGDVFNSVSTEVPAHRLLGNIALVSNPGMLDAQHWFNQFQGSGSKLIEVPERAFGPVLMSTYTLSRNALTLNAQFPQLCIEDYSTPRLAVKRDDVWQEVASSDIDRAAFVSRFSVSDWIATEPVEYRVELENKSSGDAHYYYGVIQADPVAKNEVIVSTFNCRPGVLLSDTEGWIQQNNEKPFTWTQERIAYPHSELMANADKHNSDVLTFLGDQIYEFDPNGFIDKENLETLVDDYFWKWQQFVLTVREYTRNKPSFIIPDDHDVFQGNVWGAGGIPANAEADGGFVFPSEFVQIVIKTQTGSLPTYSDNAPVAQGIDVYFTDLVYGGVGIAVLEDRKFKSNPNTPDADAILLGTRQLDFLDTWAKDWTGQELKLVISQSPFSQSTSHSGASASPNLGDKDANGWPKSGRDRAVVALRKAFAPHVSGDQHLGLSLQHGVEQHGDAVYSFAGPSMLNIFPRIWDPANANDGPGDRSVNYLGQYTDAHGNLIDVLAAANPDSYYLPTPPTGTWQKDQLGIGYGVVRMDKEQRSYTFEAWPAWVNPEDDDAATYDDWPITVSQLANDGREPLGYLESRMASVEDAVVLVTNQTTGELVYARRANGTLIELPVYDANSIYTVELTDSASGYREVFSDQRIAP